MKHFKIEGINIKEHIKAIEEYLDKIKFEENLIKIATEAMIFDVPFDKTQAHREYLKKLKKKKK